MSGPGQTGGRIRPGETAGVRLSRRRWLTGTAALVAGSCAAARGQGNARGALSRQDEAALGAMKSQARKVGIGPIESLWTDHFVGAGDAPAGFEKEAMSKCEALAVDFIDHFQKAGFQVAMPDHRLAVVVLKDASSYAAFSESKPDPSDGGHYEPDTNRLVIFDFRPEKENLGARASQVNLFTLVHETIHLLSYNTGLLSLKADLPAAISEGVATYGELWIKPRDRAAFGIVNGPRLRGIAQSVAQGMPRIPVGDLLDNDKVFDAADTYHLAYGEAWLLVHFLLRQPAWVPKFRAYLTGMPAPGGKLGRVAYAESILGPMRKLDAELKRHEEQVRRKRR